MSYGPEWDGARTQIHACTLVAGAPPQACACERRKTGYYRFAARSGDAAPVEYERYFWSTEDSSGTVSTPKLDFADKSEGATRVAGRPLRVMLQQPMDDRQVVLGVTSARSLLAPARAL